MSTMRPVGPDEPLMVAWTAFQATPEFENAKKWAYDARHLQGSLWAMFEAGFNARPRAEGTEAMARDKRLRFELDHALRDFDTLLGDDVQPEDRDALVMVRMETRTAVRLRAALTASTEGGR
jgi:hypothetical protein